MTPTLALDLDSTLWDTGAVVREAALEVTGKRLDVASTWTHVLDACGEEATTEIFDRIYAPEAIRAREPYPGAAEVIGYLQRGLGIRIHVVTRGHDPQTLRPFLEHWLGERFGPEIRLTVTTGDKLPVLREIGAFGMIDDRPETLERVADAGLWAAARIQPWNRELVTARPDVYGFSDWREVPDLLPVL